MDNHMIVPPEDFTIDLAQGSAKSAATQADARARDLLMVPVDRITVTPGLNVRIHDSEYEAHIEEIKTSIINHGFYPHYPLSGYAAAEGENTAILLTSGFTRFEAALRAIREGAPIERLPMVLRPPGTSLIDLTVSLAMDNAALGRPLKPYERAIVAKRLISYGADEAMIAQRMMVSEQYVKDLLFLLSLPQPLHQHVITGRASASHVISLARRHGPAEALQALDDTPGPAQAQPFEMGVEGAQERLRPAPAVPAADARPARMTPRNTTAAGAPVVTSKKSLLAAIDYALAIAKHGGIDWLRRWRTGDREAVAELNSYKPPRKSPGRPRGSAKPKAEPAEDDPL